MSSSGRSRSQSGSGSRTDVRAITLLPRDDVRRTGGAQKKNQWVVLVPVVLAVLLAALLSAMFLSSSGTVKEKQADLAALLRAIFLASSGREKNKQAEPATLQDELHAIPTPDASRVKTQTALAA